MEERFVRAYYFKISGHQNSKLWPWEHEEEAVRISKNQDAESDETEFRT